MGDALLYCPRCGFYFFEGENICEKCGCTELRPTGRNRAADGEIYTKEYKEWSEAFESNVIEKDPMYSPAIRQMVINKIETNYKIANGLACPKCGHDKFQMVPRKWSLLAGFMTNKVDKVCERCKTRF